MISNSNDIQAPPTPTLKLGQFLVRVFNGEKYVDVVVDRLTPQEMAEGWCQKLPRRKNYMKHTNKKDFDHFSVFLSQLPDHLFSRVKTIPNDNSEDGERYKDIIDNIYHYSVKTTPHDSKILRLQKLLQDIYSNRVEVEQLVSELEKERVKGWLILRAHYLMKEMDAYLNRFY